ncbi:MAG TPA: hypothetical protein VGF13_09615 [Verrucomicrobiae bacterium]
MLRRRPIVGENWRRDFDRIKELNGFGRPDNAERKHLTPWTQDIMRHTGISYHFAKHKHEGQTALWVGNSPDMVHRYYKGLVKPKDAKEFWVIIPDERKILKLPKAA